MLAIAAALGGHGERLQDCVPGSASVGFQVGPTGAEGAGLRGPEKGLPGEQVWGMTNLLIKAGYH